MLQPPANAFAADCRHAIFIAITIFAQRNRDEREAAPLACAKCALRESMRTYQRCRFADSSMPVNLMWQGARKPQICAGKYVPA